MGRDAIVSAGDSQSLAPACARQSDHIAPNGPFCGWHGFRTGL